MKVWTITRMTQDTLSTTATPVATTTDEAKVNGLRAAARSEIPAGSSDWIEVREN